jgi:hypothetical protein
MKPLTFYSHRNHLNGSKFRHALGANADTGQGPNPWKTVTLFEELQVPYETQFLDFGDGSNGVEGEEFKKKNPAGRVPLIYDPETGLHRS